MNVGDRVLFYSARLFPYSANVTYTGVIVARFPHPEFSDSERLTKYRVRLDKRLFGLIPVYEWMPGRDIFGVQDTSAAELERIAKL